MLTSSYPLFRSSTEYTLTEPNAAPGYSEHGMVAQNYPPSGRDPTGYEQNYTPHTTDYGYPARPQVYFHRKRAIIIECY